MVYGDDATPSEVVLPAPCLVVLVGMSGSGKSTWAAEHFAPEQIVSSDALRAVVGAGEDDITASDDAFTLLDGIVEQRARRGLTTVIDTLGLDRTRRDRCSALGRTHSLASVCVIFTTTVATARTRNSARGKAVPQRVLSGQARQLKEQRDLLASEGFDIVLTPAGVRTAPAHVAAAAASEPENRSEPATMQFGLQLPTFDWPGGAAAARATLPALA